MGKGFSTRASSALEVLIPLHRHIFLPLVQRMSEIAVGGVVGRRRSQGVWYAGVRGAVRFPHAMSEHLAAPLPTFGRWEEGFCDTWRHLAKMFLGRCTQGCECVREGAHMATLGNNFPGAHLPEILGDAWRHSALPSADSLDSFLRPCPLPMNWSTAQHSKAICRMHAPLFRWRQQPWPYPTQTACGFTRTAFDYGHRSAFCNKAARRWSSSGGPPAGLDIVAGFVAGGLRWQFFQAPPQPPAHAAWAPARVQAHEATDGSMIATRRSRSSSRDSTGSRHRTGGWGVRFKVMDFTEASS